MKKLTMCVMLVGLMIGAMATIPVTAQENFAVTIIVVDDFAETELSTADAEQLDPSASCAVSLEGQAYAVRGVSADPIEVAHGEIVYAQIEALLDEANAADVVGLVTVDIHGLTTDLVADEIQTAIDDNPSDFYVLNMSFAIIPCEYVAGFVDFGSQLISARDAKDLNRYRGLFQRAVIFYDNTVFPAMSNKAQEATDFDPLQSVLASLGSQVIPVASAGNFGLDFPFWPGAWGQVISVSASDGTGYEAPDSWNNRDDTPLLDTDSDRPGRRMRVSNYGEVMLPGEYESEMGMVSGTSFAAPRLSVVLALYVANVGGDYCMDADGNPAFASGEWDNLTLTEAVQAHCPVLEPYLP